MTGSEFDRRLTRFMEAAMRFGRDAESLDKARTENPPNRLRVDHARDRYDEAWEALKTTRASVVDAYDEAAQA